MIPPEDVREFYLRVQAERRRESLLVLCVWIAAAAMTAAILIGLLI